MAGVGRISTLAIAVLAFAAPLTAQTPSHIYSFNNTLADANAGPSMLNNGATLGANTLSFGANQGPTLLNALLNPGQYSIEMYFKLDSNAGYRKIVDYKDRSSDNGSYVLNNQLNFYPVTTGGSVLNNVFTHVMLTRDIGGTFTGYTNGNLVMSFFDGGSLATFNWPGNVMHFFRDDFATGQTEASGGQVDYIRLYDEMLTPDQVYSRYQNRADEFEGAGNNNVTPEPISMTLLGTGLAGVAAARRRRRAATAA